jgi:DNA-binding XRE family transcriptional regulator
MTFGQWLKNKRVMTLRDLSADIKAKIGADIHFTTLSQMETDDYIPSEKIAKQLAAYYAADEEEVLYMAMRVAETMERIKKQFPNCYGGENNAREG